MMATLVLNKLKYIFVINANCQPSNKRVERIMLVQRYAMATLLVKLVWLVVFAINPSRQSPSMDLAQCFSYCSVPKGTDWKGNTNMKCNTEAYSELIQISKMKRFAKLVNGF